MRGENVNGPFDLALDPGGRPMVATPLMVAAGSGYGATLDTVRLLVDLGADVSIDLGAGTAARFAAGGLGWNYRPGGDAARLEWLLARGLDPNEVDRRGVTLLAEAAGTGDGDRVRVLLSGGANPDPPRPIEYGFQSPIFCAAEVGDADMVRALLAAGARMTDVDNQAETALFYANQVDTMEVLLGAGLDLDARNEYGWTPLTSAVVDGNLDKVRALLAVGADPNGTHDRGYTVFMSAASSMERSREMMRLLLDAGADPMAVTELGWNVFHAAIDVNGEANSEASVRSTLGFLASLGVDIHHRSNSGETPLARARCHGTELEVRVLLELGARE